MIESVPFPSFASRAVWLAWKEFDGDETTVLLINSRDGGRNWTSPKTLARTSDSSDHPLLIAQRDRIFRSWMTRAQGYQFFSLEDLP